MFEKAIEQDAAAICREVSLAQVVQVRKISEPGDAINANWTSQI
jgi:hypothetical protein